MAYIVMAYIVVGLVVGIEGQGAKVERWDSSAVKSIHAQEQARPKTVMAYIVMACIGMAYIVMACILMAYVVMAYVVMAYVVMATGLYRR